MIVSGLFYWTGVRSAKFCGAQPTLAVHMCDTGGGGFSQCPLRSTELSPICPPLNICRGSASGHSGLPQLFVRRWAPKEPVLGTHLPAAFSLSPVGNWHIPSLIITAMWHVYSQRWADLHRRHILALGVSARCPFEASLRLRWLKIPSCYIFLGQ